MSDNIPFSDVLADALTDPETREAYEAEVAATEQEMIDAEMDAAGYNDPADYYEEPDPLYDQGYANALEDQYLDEADLLLYVPVSFRGTLTVTVAD